MQRTPPKLPVAESGSTTIREVTWESHLKGRGPFQLRESKFWLGALHMARTLPEGSWAFMISHVPAHMQGWALTVQSEEERQASCSPPGDKSEETRPNRARDTWGACAQGRAWSSGETQNLVWFCFCLHHAASRTSRTRDRTQALCNESTEP